MQQNNELPEGWAYSILSEVIIHALGGDWGKEPSTLIPEGMTEVNVIRGTEFKKWNNEKGSSAVKRIIKESSLAKRSLQENDIVIEISGGGPDQPVGRTLIIDEEAIKNSEYPLVCSNFCRQVRLSPHLSANYVNLALTLQYNNGLFNKYQSQTTNIRNLQFQGFISGIKIPFPPLNEQHRIVSAIEALFARLDETNEKLDRVPHILKKFRESVLAAACDGRLTEDWRKENSYVTNPDDYLREICEIRSQCSKKDNLKFRTASELDVLCNLSEIPDTWLWIPSNVAFSYVTSGSRGWAKYYSSTGSIFLRIGNLDRNSIYLKLEDIQRVTPPDSAEGRRTRIQKNDVLISITADIGSIGYIFEEIGDAYINQHIALARPVQNLNPKYIAYFLHSQTGGKKQFEKLHRGATKIGLGLDDIRSIAIPLPPLPEQHEIVKRIDTLFAFADSIETRVAAAREKTEKLRQSILAKAFSGELVPTEAEIARREGRDYESAEVLLERIKKERGKSGKKQ